MAETNDEGESDAELPSSQTGQDQLGGGSSLTKQTYRCYYDVTLPLSLNIRSISKMYPRLTMKRFLCTELNLDR